MNDKIVGIYCIQNMINGKRYIGSSKDIYVRFSQHKGELNKGKHINTLLQRAWNKYGKENFKFYIMEETGDILTRRELLELEDFYIEKYKTYKDENGYNIAKPTETFIRDYNENFYENFFNTNNKISREQFDEIIFYLCNTDLPNKKIADLVGISNRNVVAIYERQNFYELTKDLVFRKRSGAHPKINDNIAKEIIDLSLKGFSAPEINKELGLSLSYSTISDIRNHRTWCHLTDGIVFPKYKHDKGFKKPLKQIDKNGIEINRYESARQAQRVTGINYKDISSVCLGNKNMAGGYYWEFI